MAGDSMAAPGELYEFLWDFSLDWRMLLLQLTAFEKSECIYKVTFHTSDTLFGRECSMRQAF